MAGLAVPGTPVIFTSRILTTYDNGQTLICATSQTATVNAGLPLGFGVTFKGTIAFTAGSGVVLTDTRTNGATYPWCSLLQTNTAATTYDIVGGMT